MLISLDRLVAYSVKNGVNIIIAKTYGSIIPINRNKLALKAIENNADYTLLIDSDMVFDEDALVKLLKHDRDIVSAVCVCKTPPYDPVAKLLNKDGGYTVREGLGEDRFYSDLDMVGAAFMLIKTDVYRKMSKPYFAMPKFFDSVMGEDVYFCRKAKDLGYKICIDTSLDVGHIGEMIYGIDHHIEYMEAKENE